MERMSPLDATFLHIEDGINHMHIASCAVFEGPAPAYADLVALFRGKLPLVPRYRQKVRFIPGGVGRPVWVDDPHFRLDYHVPVDHHDYSVPYQRATDEVEIRLSAATVSPRATTATSATSWAISSWRPAKTTRR